MSTPNPKFNSIVLLQAFNNYFNRKIKYSNDVSTIINDYAFQAFTDINFNPNDDVSTEIVFNFDKISIDPDYVLVCENCEEPEDDNPDIVSHWFVLESSRLRNGQYRLKLRRDVIADHFDKIRVAPIFVQKAWLKESDPFIFNSEGMNFNQKKIGELLLKDDSKSPWLVAYIARGQVGTISVQNNSAVNDYLQISDIANATGISQATLTAMINTDGQPTQTKGVYTNNKLSFIYTMLQTTPPVLLSHARWILTTNDSLQFLRSEEGTKTYGSSSNVACYASTGIYDYNSMKTTAQKLVVKLNDDLSNIKSSLSSAVSEEIITDYQINLLNASISGKVILYGGKYYTASVARVGNIGSTYLDFSVATYPSIATAFSTSATGVAYRSQGVIRFSYSRQNIAIMLTQVQAGVSTLVLSASRNVLENKEYDMLCMPYNDLEIATNATSTQSETSRIYGSDYWRTDGTYYYYRKTFTPTIPIGSIIQDVVAPNAYNISNTQTTYTLVFRSVIPYLDTDYVNIATTITTLLPAEKSQGDVCRRIASQIGRQLGAECYDVQLLPYCPLTDKVYQNGIDISGMTADKDYSYIMDSSSNIVGICFYCKYDSFQVYINEQINTQEESLKIENECNSYRLVSPNYQGTFDFSVAKNGGSVPSFNAFCTYKPYTPYIKVAPFFMNLYGAEYGDNRGLICGGDFSITRVDEAWVNYQLNNKNYQNIFNRDIQNLDFNQSIEMRLQVLGASVGVLSDSMKGASTGFNLSGGSPYGAIAGGIVGGMASAVGGIIDTNILAQQQREARSMAIDKYNYSLGNIKALPYTITKVGAFDINSKIFPFVEFYSCTEEEKEALKSKLQYESMTTMRIGTIDEFITPEEHYFKGELIRLEDLSAETHLVMAIYEELLKGVYIYE